MKVLMWTTAVVAASVLFFAESSHAFASSSSISSISSSNSIHQRVEGAVPQTSPPFLVQQQFPAAATSFTRTAALWGGMSNYDGGTDGTDVAPKILAVVCFIAVWLFSIPPEFRRARFCSTADTVKYPEVCTTPAIWSSQIKDYYTGGGGVHFDFSIEKAGNPWVGGSFREGEE